MKVRESFPRQNRMNVACHGKDRKSSSPQHSCLNTCQTCNAVGVISKLITGPEVAMAGTASDGVVARLSLLGIGIGLPLDMTENHGVIRWWC